MTNDGLLTPAQRAALAHGDTWQGIERERKFWHWGEHRWVHAVCTDIGRRPDFEPWRNKQQEEPWEPNRSGGKVGAKRWGATKRVIHDVLKGGQELTTKELAECTGLSITIIHKGLTRNPDLFELLDKYPQTWRLKDGVVSSNGRKPEKCSRTTA